MSLVQRSGLDREAEGLTSVIERSEAVDAVMAVAVGDGDGERQLAAMLEADEF